MPNFGKLLEATRASENQCPPKNTYKTARTAGVDTETNLELGESRTSNNIQQDLDGNAAVRTPTNVAGGARQDGRQPVIVALEASIAAQTASLKAQEALLSAYLTSNEQRL